MATVDADIRATPARVFLSYKRHVAPDQGLAEEVVAALSKAGVAVLVDQRLTIGQTWAREIESHIRQADFLILLLTPESSRSEMVRGEIEIARHHQAAAGRPRILPVRVGFDAGLPYPLNAYLDHIQYAVWNSADDTPGLIDQLMKAITGNADEGTDIAPPGVTAPADLAPRHAAPLPIPGGTLSVDDPWYLARPADATALAAAAQRGQTVTIKGPRQMGKSSLLMRIVKAAIDAGKQAALLDFQLVDDESKRSADVFFRRFASSIAEQLEMPDTVSDMWDAGFSNPQNCTRYVERQILQPLGSPCMLAIDETDAIFRASFSADFFAMLRSWHGLRAHPVRRAWKQLDIVLSTSTEPQFLIDRPHESPFNVGLVVPLDDFALEQVARLNALHPRPLADAALVRLHALVGGHPYLTRKALYMAAGAAPTCGIEDLFRDATNDGGPFGDHLRYYLLRLHDKPELIAQFQEVIAGHGGGDDLLLHRLLSAGLVRRSGSTVVPRCELYARYFGERLHDQG